MRKKGKESKLFKIINSSIGVDQISDVCHYWGTKLLLCLAGKSRQTNHVTGSYTRSSALKPVKTVNQPDRYVHVINTAYVNDS